MGPNALSGLLFCESARLLESPSLPLSSFPPAKNNKNLDDHNSIIIIFGGHSTTTWTEFCHFLTSPELTVFIPIDTNKIRRPPKRRLRNLFQACKHAALPDFLTFRQPSSYQKLPLVVHWLLSLQRQPKVITLCVYKLAMDLRGYADFANCRFYGARYFVARGFFKALVGKKCLLVKFFLSTKYCIGNIILCREKFIRTRIRILAPGMACCHARMHFDRQSMSCNLPV